MNMAYKSLLSELVYLFPKDKMKSLLTQGIEYLLDYLYGKTHV